MKSPFPSMDPYMERRWQSVHASLIVFARGRINDELRRRGGRYVTEIEERLIIEPFQQPRRPIRPDLFVVGTGQRGGKPDVAGDVDADGGVAVAEPFAASTTAKRVRYARTIDRVPQRFLQIIDTEGGEVVTVIEFVSPSNKVPGDAQEQYRRKQQEALQANINLVEIDLTRRGERVLAMIPDDAVGEHTYLACVTRGFNDPAFEINPISLRERLPEVAIPLRHAGEDVSLALQDLVEAAYTEGLLYRRLDYATRLDPPLPPEDGGWAEGLVKAATAPNA